MKQFIILKNINRRYSKTKGRQQVVVVFMYDVQFVASVTFHGDEMAWL